MASSPQTLDGRSIKINSTIKLRFSIQPFYSLSNQATTSSIGLSANASNSRS